jgi:glycosyltransferase involved in cell wall biosynthesis
VSNKSIRVGFALAPGDWLGGRNYFRNLFAAVRALPGEPITPVLFTGKRQPDVSGDFPGIEIVRSSMLDRRTPAWFLRKIITKATSQDLSLRRLLLRHGVSVVSHSSYLDFDPGDHVTVKTIAWLADFQHINMPEFFTPEERRSRDHWFRTLCARCDKVIMSSENARADLHSFLPEYAHKAELLRFVASPIPFADAPSLPELQQLYKFEGPYFLLPNQFWAHKNHRVVIGALQELKRQGKPLLVLATGSHSDPRNPAFFQSLMRYASECDVLDCFRPLGQIPFHHLAGLMQHTVAFINPSFFEGWSTSVEEAKSMGKQIVLSDLPVHREQAPERGFFFPAQDPLALADAMKAAYDEFDERRDAAMQEAARSRFPERQRAFGETYLRIVEAV